MSEGRYVLTPQADHELEDQAYYYAFTANPELGHRFLAAAHGTFALLATQPNMGWRLRVRSNEVQGLKLF